MMQKSKTAVVTGGAGGLGGAFALALIKRGWRVFSLDIKTDGEDVPGLTRLYCDVSSGESVAECAEAVGRQAECVDLVADFAGSYRMAVFSELSEEDFKRALDVNLLGAHRVNKAFLPYMKPGRRIFIVTSELAATDALPFTGLYAVCKHALDSYADSLRFELSLLDIEVITVRPGAFATSLTDEAEKELERLCASTALFTDSAARFRKIVNSQTGSAKNPAILAEVMARAAEAGHPKAVYTVNASIALKLLSALPKRIQVAIIKRILKRK